MALLFGALMGVMAALKPIPWAHDRWFKACDPVA
jgi:hypothetical protein